jgi:hypothetical protein
VLRAKLKKSEQYLVLFLSKLVHRAICGLLQNSVDDRLLEFISDFRDAEDFNHRGQWIHQVFHEMFDSARASTQMPLQTGPHHSPPQSRPITNGVVRVRDTQHPLLNEIHDLFIKGRLEAVRDVAGKLLSKVDGLLSDQKSGKARRPMTIGQRFMCQPWVLDQARKAFSLGFLIALRA